MANNKEKLEMCRRERIGEVSYTKCGTPAIIVEYESWKNVFVEFQDEYKYIGKTSYGNFKKGQMKNPYDKTFFGIGYIGVGEYNYNNSGYIMKIWRNILERCNLSRERYLLDSSVHTYMECEISDEWLNFQNFAKWYHENEYDCYGEKLNIDKDIKNHGNKIYCKEYCSLVPEKINYLFIKAGKKRDNGLPIGVKCKNNIHIKKFVTTLSKYNKTMYIGTFDNPHEAFLAYKKEKEKYIKELANEYKNIIPKDLYDTLINYKVLETD